MNNQPVLWTDGNGNYFHQEIGYYTIPLYTHQAKKLTDDEILSCWDAIDPPEECWVTEKHQLDFARAILRKAQE